MRALTVVAGRADSMAVSDVPEPEPAADEILVRGLAVGVCGTDREIAAAEYGEAPPGREHLVIGHESLGRVVSAPENSGFDTDDYIVGIVRRPDPEPCGACARGEFDMCRNGRYTERGIKGLDGYASQQWVVPTEYAVKVPATLGDLGILVEPASVLAKAWDQIDAVGNRSWFAPESVLVTGAGPIGLLAAMFGVQRGLDVHVLDRVEDGPKPRLVEALGATYHHEDMRDLAGRLEPDIVIEATGAPAVITPALTVTGPYGIVCVTGVSTPGRTTRVDMGEVNREIVLDNDVVIGSVNANRRHYAGAVDALAAADRDWVARLISRRVPLSDFAEAFAPLEDDVKVVITIDG
ncbi:threonine dehydrogenase-like Zn-dependent dehydrogenase [Stackebrandtia albiflava]|uniref:Threonine dehydrogenase-like Zn-dependent dehydrogenase n=1 Tax=Stackebrandtia albiflava TaxID=406432 RepID=A0A562V573_9ACTN|nr:glucose 1-dehydrogenase [Stackebrandtia albiflava]TWJ12968.1 threonine dehydrogenase-like Zn-dependent dehydrogenase [Stackebrandtia albiflava]